MKDKKIQELKRYFEGKKEVVLAFLFGSQGKNISRSISDWDISVYFKPKEYLELETEEDYPDEKEIWADLVNISDNSEISVFA
ncbi:MAG: nucleotidyltransferase domain-containing protein [bacterium]